MKIFKKMTFVFSLASLLALGACTSEDKSEDGTGEIDSTIIKYQPVNAETKRLGGIEEGFIDFPADYEEEPNPEEYGGPTIIYYTSNERIQLRLSPETRHSELNSKVKIKNAVDFITEFHYQDYLNKGRTVTKTPINVNGMEGYRLNLFTTDNYNKEIIILASPNGIRLMEAYYKEESTEEYRKMIQTYTEDY